MLNKKRVFIVSLVLFFILVLMSFAQAQASYKFTVSNKGDEEEVYDLSVDIFSEYITFSDNPAGIDPGESKTITLNANIPCEKEGSYKLNFILYSQKSKGTTKIPFDVNVVSCYGYNVRIGEKVATKNATKVVFKPYEGIYELCRNEEASIPVLVTNKGKAKAFKFKLEDIGFAKLSGKKLVLQANQKGVLYIIIEPKKQGNHSFNLSIMTDRVRRIPVDLNAVECYSVGVAFGVDSISICGCEPYSYDFFVGNEGVEEGEFDLKLEGPEWVSLGLNQNLELKSGEVINAGLNIDAPCREGNYDANVIAYSVDKPDIKAEDSLGITILSKDDCYKTEIEAEKTIKIDEAGVYLPVNLTNYGEEQITYSVNLEGPEWVSSDKGEVSLKPGETSAINLNIRPGEDIKRGNYKIKISLDSEKVSYSKDILVKLRKKSLVFEKITNWYDSYKPYVLGVAGIVLVLVILPFLVITFKRTKEIKFVKKRKRKQKRNILMWIIFILVILLLYLISMFGSPIWDFIVWYRYYIYTVVIVAGIVYWISKYFGSVQKKSKKKKERKKPKKIEEKKKSGKNLRKKKKKRKYVQYLLITIIILVLIALLVYFSFYYGLLQYAGDFILIYYPYFIAGAIILTVLILLLGFGAEKDKKKKRKKKS